MLANPFNGLKYLIVDDYADMRSMVKAIFQALGVPAEDIGMTRNGEEAIELMTENHYDVVLCDYNLGPGKDGQQVLEEARQRGLLGLHSIFIMITAESTRDMVMGVVEYEPDNYLSKPFNKDLLRVRMTKLFDRKRSLQPVNEALTRNNYSKALDLLNKLIAGRPKYLPDLLRIKADISISAGRYDDALNIYDKALAAREMTWAKMGKAKVLFSKKQYGDARAIFQELIEQHPNLVAAFDWLARIQVIEGRTKEAEQTLAQAIALSPKAVRRQHELGDLALQNGNIDSAEKAFGKAIRFGRHSVFNHPSTYSGLAKSKSANDKHDEAEKIVQDIGKNFDNSAEAQFYQAASKAIIRQNQGDEAGAISELMVAEQFMNQIDHGATGALGLEMAQVCTQLGQQEKAADLLQSVVANNHDDDVLLGTVGMIFKDAGLHESPEKIIERIRKDVFIKNNRGVKLIREGNLDAAIELLHDAAEELSSNKTINLNAAKAFIMKMEAHGSTAADIRQVSQYMERVKKIAPDDWRLASLLPRMQRLVRNLQTE